MDHIDFTGWATKANVRCSDGKIIKPGAFSEQDGTVVPMVWMHQHYSPSDCIGHALLENRAEGVYMYGSFNDTQRGKDAKNCVLHGDVNSISIYANQLSLDGDAVEHGCIREVSLVLAGANPEACIDNVIRHGEILEDEAYIYTGENIEIYHAEEGKEKRMDNEEKKNKEENNGGEETVADVFNTFTEKQKKVVYAMIGAALENEEEEDTEDMKHNAFDNEERDNTAIMHDAMNAIIGDAKRFGSMKESFIQHADEYGIQNIEYLFPEARNVTTTPEFIKRDTNWVGKVMAGVHKSPFSRIKSTFADITEDEARAKGYMKGKLKKEEVFSLLKRTTTPTTVYKKQKMDRDDVIDITDFDVISFLKTEMREMLNEELARAFLIGDGRLASDDDKINESNIRPIWKDESLFTINKRYEIDDKEDADKRAKAFIEAAIRARKDYKGSGEPTLYTTEDTVTDCLLLTDTTGRDIYDSVEKLTKKLRVKEIVTVPVMENLKREDSGTTYQLTGIIVNLNDYSVGADKGGAINMFDDFDIDYNQMKYLIETRCSGALTKPYSAIALEMKVSP